MAAIKSPRNLIVRAAIPGGRRDGLGSPSSRRTIFIRTGSPRHDDVSARPAPFELARIWMRPRVAVGAGRAATAARADAG